MTHTSLFENSDIVHTYTREQAIEDGYLIDVSDLAQEAGFTCPVAITLAAYDKYVHWTEEDNKRQIYQDIEGRLWDILGMMRFQKKRIDTNGLFEFLCVPRSDKSRRQRPLNITLKSLSHAGDNGEQVITIMLPDED